MQESTQKEDKAKIEQAIDQFIHAYNSADLEGVVSYDADDLLKIRLGGPPETKSQTASRVKEVFANFNTRVDVENEEIEISGDLAFTRGVFAVTLTPKAGGESKRAERRYLEIWRRENECWLVARTMDNTA
jgi:ketosteroid isomerase-like protein